VEQPLPPLLLCRRRWYCSLTSLGWTFPGGASRGASRGAAAALADRLRCRALTWARGNSQHHSCARSPEPEPELLWPRQSSSPPPPLLPERELEASRGGAPAL